MFKDESYLPPQGSLEVILTIMAKIPTTSPSGQRIHQLIRTCRRTIGPDEFRGCETQNQLLNLLYREKSGRSEEVRKKQDHAIQARLLLINEWHEQKCVREMLKDYDDLLEELIERNEGDMFELRGRIRDVKSYLSEQDEKFAALDEDKKGEEAKKTVLEEFDGKPYILAVLVYLMQANIVNRPSTLMSTHHSEITSSLYS